MHRAAPTTVLLCLFVITWSQASDGSQVRVRRQIPSWMFSGKSNGTPQGVVGSGGSSHARTNGGADQSIPSWLYTKKRSNDLEAGRERIDITKYVHKTPCGFFPGICKRPDQAAFECRCPKSRAFCVSTGDDYAATCVPETWIAGRTVWRQP